MNFDNDIEEIPITLTIKKKTLQRAHLIAAHYNQDIDSFISSEIESIISSLLETPELQHVFKKY